MKVEKTKITPAMAKAWLEKIPEKQRKRNEERVNALSDVIKAGGWRENGASIVFDRSGALIDGQHRVDAIARSGRAVYAIIVSNVDSTEDTFNTIDDGKARKLSDFINVPNPNHAAAIARYYWCVQRGFQFQHGPKTVVPIAEAVQIIQPYLEDIGARYALVREAASVTGLPSYMGFLDFYYRHFIKVPDAVMNTFLEKMANGISLETGSPIAALRNRCLRMTSNATVHRTSMMALMLKTLNAFLLGQKVSRVTYDPTKEEFPQLLEKYKSRSTAA